jgi:hypothetical protein
MDDVEKSSKVQVVVVLPNNEIIKLGKNETGTSTTIILIIVKPWQKDS